MSPWSAVVQYVQCTLYMYIVQYGIKRCHPECHPHIPCNVQLTYHYQLVSSEYQTSFVQSLVQPYFTVILAAGHVYKYGYLSLIGTLVQLIYVVWVNVSFRIIPFGFIVAFWLYSGCHSGSWRSEYCRSGVVLIRVRDYAVWLRDYAVRLRDYVVRDNVDASHIGMADTL